MVLILFTQQTPDLFCFYGHYHSPKWGEVAHGLLATEEFKSRTSFTHALHLLEAAGMKMYSVEGQKEIPSGACHILGAHFVEHTWPRVGCCRESLGNKQRDRMKDRDNIFLIYLFFVILF